MGLQTQWLLQIQEFINRRIRSDAWKSPGNLLSWTLEINFFPNRYSLRSRFYLRNHSKYARENMVDQSLTINKHKRENTQCASHPPPSSPLTKLLPPPGLSPPTRDV